LAMLMALVLSHMRETWKYSSPKSLKVYVIQSNWEQQLATATYSTSMVDWAALDCCHTYFSKENQVHNYMHAKIKFHAYSDI
jgi:hypothetical protein